MTQSKYVQLCEKWYANILHKKNSTVDFTYENELSYGHVKKLCDLFPKYASNVISEFDKQLTIEQFYNKLAGVILEITTTAVIFDR